MTIIWVLVIIASNMGGHGWGNRVTMIEFTSQERCEAARNFVRHARIDHNEAECFQK